MSQVTISRGSRRRRVDVLVARLRTPNALWHESALQSAAQLIQNKRQAHRKAADAAQEMPGRAVLCRPGLSWRAPCGVPIWVPRLCDNADIGQSFFSHRDGLVSMVKHREALIWFHPVNRSLLNCSSVRSNQPSLWCASLLGGSCIGRAVWSVSTDGNAKKRLGAIPMSSCKQSSRGRWLILNRSWLTRASGLANSFTEAAMARGCCCHALVIVGRQRLRRQEGGSGR